MGLISGSYIGSYKIISPLGAGGMGEVYLAQDERLRRKVALKLLFQDVTQNEDWIRRFEQEAYAASALNHPNIITIYEVGQFKHSHFISTEFIEGQTLRQRLREQNATLGETLDIAIQVAAALVAAHSAGIVHRDIKPENVMLRSDGYVKVLDFGLAKFTEQPSQRSDHDAETQHIVNTSPGVVMGTVSYMSPEQARGTRVDERSDIFSFGVLLYEMLSGRLPFEGETHSDIIFSIISSKRQPPLARYMNEISPELERIVAKSLNKSKDDRYQTLKDLLIDLKSYRRRLDREEDFADSSEPSLRTPVGTSTAGAGKVTVLDEQTARTQPIVQPHVSSAEFIFNRIKRHKKVALVTAAVVLAAVVALSAYYFFWVPKIDSIAMLPLSMASADPATEQMGEEITQQTINNLSQMSGLRVISFNAVQHYKGKQLDLQSVGRELNVRALLLGRIFKRSNTTIVSLELIDTRDRSQLWNMERPVKSVDYTLVPGEILTSLASKIGITASAEAKKKLDAESAYTKGRSAWNLRTQDGMNQALTHFEQALALNPQYALAHAGLADTYNMLATYGGRKPTEAFPKAHDAAIKALALDNNLAEGHAALAYTTFRSDWKWAEAEREFKQAINLNDNYASAHQWYGTFLAARGRVDEAVRETQRTQEIEKNSPIIASQLGLVYFLGHRYDEAIAACQKIIATEPGFFAARRYIGLSYTQKKMHAQALAEFQQAVQLSNNSPLMKAEYADALARSGDIAKAQTELNNAIEVWKQKRTLAYQIAAIYVGLNDKDKAFEWLNNAFQDRADWLVFLKVDPRFDALHSDPRFGELLRRMNLE